MSGRVNNVPLMVAVRLVRRVHHWKVIMVSIDEVDAEAAMYDNVLPSMNSEKVQINIQLITCLVGYKLEVVVPSTE